VRRTLLPDLLLDARGARSNVAVTVESGRVAEVGPATGGEKLPGRALAPGFVNAHSHAFQRALRGRVERRDPDHPEDDFWTWREQMYALAESLDPDIIREASEGCYREMLSALRERGRVSLRPPPP
jgi:formimidoylglutamate deiminase